MSENKIHDGGPAYPHIKEVKKENGQTNSIKWFPGMSLRDYFAGQALNNELPYNRRDDRLQGIAEAAYEMADAMIKERDK